MGNRFARFVPLTGWQMDGFRRGGVSPLDPIDCFFQHYFTGGHPHTIRRLLSPGAGVQVLDTIDKLLFSIMGMAAGHGFEPVFSGVMDGV